MNDPIPPAQPAPSGPVFPPGYPRTLKPEELRLIEPSVRPTWTIGLIALALVITYALLPSSFPGGLRSDPLKNIGVLAVLFAVALPVAWWVRQSPPKSPGLSKLAGTLLFPAYIIQSRPVEGGKLELSVIYREGGEDREVTVTVPAPKDLPELETKMVPLLKLPDGDWYPLVEHAGKPDIA